MCACTRVCGIERLRAAVTTACRVLLDLPPAEQHLQHVILAERLREKTVKADRHCPVPVLRERHGSERNDGEPPLWFRPARLLPFHFPMVEGRVVCVCAHVSRLTSHQAACDQLGSRRRKENKGQLRVINTQTRHDLFRHCSADHSPAGGTATGAMLIKSICTHASALSTTEVRRDGAEGKELAVRSSLISSAQEPVRHHSN